MFFIQMYFDVKQRSHSGGKNEQEKKNLKVETYSLINHSRARRLYNTCCDLRFSKLQQIYVNV